MPRKARAVAVGYPHHITQRGNNRAPVFFDDQDRLTYLSLLERYSKKYLVNVWAYCLMDNHVHLLAVPDEPESFARGIGVVNMTYTQYVNRKYQRVGRIWQSRFFSAVVDTDKYTWAVARYIEKNPIVAGLVKFAEAYEWSSARFNLQGKPDSLLAKSAWLEPSDRERYGSFLLDDDKRVSTMIGQATRSGQPICESSELAKWEAL
jgi:putative transposase